MQRHNTRVWLVNTGWIGGAYGTGKRIKLGHTRAIIDAIHDGTLAQTKRQRDPVFGFEVVAECPGVPPQLLVPRETWGDTGAYDASAAKLANLFRENFKAYEGGVSVEVKSAEPAGA
jgi:phosphoenolpyruvate carboxykinase (ATP)